MKKFEDLLTFLDSIPCINEGGCGIAALVMYRWLRSKNRKSPEIFFFYTPWNNALRLNERAKTNKNERGFACSHAYIKFKGKFFDSEGIKTKNYYAFHPLPEDVTVKIINNIETWSYCFNRKKYVPIIQRTTGIDLSDIKISPRKFCKSE